jgi:hypothetical protein
MVKRSRNRIRTFALGGILLCIPGGPFLRAGNAGVETDDGKIVVRSVDRAHSSTGANNDVQGILNYYVNPSTGNDSQTPEKAQNPSTPWRTPNRAFKSMKIGPNGTILHLAAGTYSANVACENKNTVDMCITEGGTSSTARLTIQCDAMWSRPSSSGCMLRGTPTGYISVYTADHVIIAGFDVGGFSGAGYGIINFCDRLKAVNLACPHGNDVIIESNYVHDLGSTTTYNVNGNPSGPGCPMNGAIGSGQHGYFYTTPPIIIGNFVANVYNKNASPPCNFSHGIYPANPGTQVYNNVVINAATLGIQVYSSACGTVLANNVTANNGGSGIVLTNTDAGCSAYGVPSGFNTVINNISVNNGGKGFHQTSPGSDCTATTPSLFSNNMTFGNAGGAQDLGSCDNWTQDPPLARENPAATFVKYQADGLGDYRLNSGSVAIGKGISRCAPRAPYSTCTTRRDFQGSVWNAARDIGAYANGSTPKGYPLQFSPNGLVSEAGCRVPPLLEAGQAKGPKAVRDLRCELPTLNNLFRIPLSEFTTASTERLPRLR